METNAGGEPTPQEAREMLRQLGEDEDAVRYPPLPRWFFAAMAAAVGALCLIQLLPPSGAGRAIETPGTLAIAAAAGLLGSKYWLHRDGAAWVSVKLSDMVPFLAGILGTFAVCWAVSEATEAGWIWIVGAAVVSGIVLRTGSAYRREFGDGA